MIFIVIIIISIIAIIVIIIVVVVVTVIIFGNIPYVSLDSMLSAFQRVCFGSKLANGSRIHRPESSGFVLIRPQVFCSERLQSMAPRRKAKLSKPQKTPVKVIFKAFLISIYEFIPNRLNFLVCLVLHVKL